MTLVLVDMSCPAGTVLAMDNHDASHDELLGLVESLSAVANSLMGLRLVGPCDAAAVAAIEWTIQGVIDVVDQPVTAAEVAMVPLLRSVADAVDVRVKRSVDQVRLAGELRVAVADLNLGLGLDLDWVGISFFEVAVALLTVLRISALSPTVGLLLAGVLRLGAAALEVARERDVRSELSEASPMLLFRPGAGSVVVSY
jgi:hypothetical protein